VHEDIGEGHRITHENTTLKSTTTSFVENNRIYDEHEPTDNLNMSHYDNTSVKTPQEATYLEHVADERVVLGLMAMQAKTASKPSSELESSGSTAHSPISVSSANSTIYRPTEALQAYSDILIRRSKLLDIEAMSEDKLEYLTYQHVSPVGVAVVSTYSEEHTSHNSQGSRAMQLKKLLESGIKSSRDESNSTTLPYCHVHQIPLSTSSIQSIELASHGTSKVKKLLEYALNITRTPRGRGLCLSTSKYCQGLSQEVLESDGSDGETLSIIQNVSEFRDDIVSDNSIDDTFSAIFML